MDLKLSRINQVWFFSRKPYQKNVLNGTHFLYKLHYTGVSFSSNFKRWVVLIPILQDKQSKYEKFSSYRQNDWILSFLRFYFFYMILDPIEKILQYHLVVLNGIVYIPEKLLLYDTGTN